MNKTNKKHNLQIDSSFYSFIENDVLPGIDINPTDFWEKLSDLVTELTPINKALLNTREDLQSKIDQWHQENSAEQFNFKEYKQFLKAIDYIAKDCPEFTISTDNVDDELATLAGPQLVVPVMNARFALNAVNARWGSLYDALYGTDVISDEGGADKTKQYNPIRGEKVIQFGRAFLNDTLPLTQGSHHDASQYQIINGQLQVTLTTSEIVSLKTPDLLKGFQGEQTAPSSILFCQNGLHFELNFNATSEIAKRDKAGMSDITLESALTTIMDCEDSVAAVDVEDKIITYKNWLGLNKGDLTEELIKNGQTITRKMVDDRTYSDLIGNSLTLKGRSLMFVRNVGHLMTTSAILDQQGQEIPEGILDAVITSLISLHDIQGNSQFKNSQKKSIYIVKPKMHGPEEVSFTNKLFTQVENMLSLPKNTIKMGIMDEERRTSINLKSCIYAAKERVVFINTGFLDRTGDEIHTSMHAGAFTRKAEIKNKPWIGAYEKNNVDVGLACGFSGKAQIGKGMWAMPDQMDNMMKAKVDHPNSGATTAWVPSPTAATLHAIHYHEVDVFNVQQQLKKRIPASIDDILTIPLADNTDWTEQEIADEIDNNVQGILGYVVRWVNQGIGCSKVPDINDVGLMEDRATLRISSQHIANWMKHNICTREQVMNSFIKMAKIVDKQNELDEGYTSLSDNLENSLAFEAATKLVFLGESQPSGYTEPLLHKYRVLAKKSII